MIELRFERRGVFTKTDLVLNTKVASTCDECLGQGYMEGQYAFTPFAGMVPVPCKYCLGTGTIYTDYKEWMDKQNRKAAMNYLTYPNISGMGTMTSGGIVGNISFSPFQPTSYSFTEVSLVNSLVDPNASLSYVDTTTGGVSSVLSVPSVPSVTSVTSVPPVSLSSTEGQHTGTWTALTENL